MAEPQDILLQKIKDQGDLVRKLKAAKESSEKGKSDKNSCQDLGEINKHLSEFSYVSGYMPSKIDVELHYNLKSNIEFQKYPHIKRWWYHMRSFSDSEIALFPIIHPSDTDVMNAIKGNKKSLDLQVCDLTVAVLTSQFVSNS